MHTAFYRNGRAKASRERKPPENGPENSGGLRSQVALAPCDGGSDCAESADGGAINAAKLMPHFRSFAPAAKVVVFSQGQITIAECVTCMRLGAIGVVPKGASAMELADVAHVHAELGDQDETREQVIRLLWAGIDDKHDANQAGRNLEMLVINLFNSSSAFSVLNNNITTDAGEIDVLVKSERETGVFAALRSRHIVVECKNREDNLDLKAFNQLTALVRTRGRWGNVGIAIATSQVTVPFAAAAARSRGADECQIFYIDRAGLEQLVDAQHEARDEVLESLLEAQLGAA